MARLANLNGVSDKFSAIPKLPKLQNPRKRLKIIGFLGKQTEVSSHHSSFTRRLALTSIVSVALFGNASVEIASANEYWLDGPLPVPSVYNSKLAFWLKSFEAFCFWACFFIRVQLEIEKNRGLTRINFLLQTLRMRRRGPDRFWRRGFT